MYIRDMCSDHNSDCTFMHIVHKYWSRHFRSPGGHSVLRRGRGAEIACLPTCILYLSTTKQARTSGGDCKYLPFGASQRWRERIEPGIPRPPRTVRRGDNYLHVQHAALFFLMGATENPWNSQPRKQRQSRRDGTCKPQTSPLLPKVNYLWMLFQMMLFPWEPGSVTVLTYGGY